MNGTNGKQSDFPDVALVTATVRAFRASQAMGKAALNEQGCNSREVVLTAARLKPTFCNLTF